MNSSRKQEMGNTRRAVKMSYKIFKGSDPLDEKLSHLHTLLNKRMNERGIRSLFARLIYRYVAEQAQAEGIELRNIKKEVFEEHLPFVAETIIAVQYYENQILDGKGGIRDFKNNWDKQKIDHNLLASHLIKDELYNFIEEKIFPGNLEDARTVTKTVRRIFRLVDLGQEFQDHYGTIEAYASNMSGYKAISKETDIFIDRKIIKEFWELFKEIPTISENEWFVRNYLQRIYLTSGALFFEIARPDNGFNWI